MNIRETTIVSGGIANYKETCIVVGMSKHPMEVLAEIDAAQRDREERLKTELLVAKALLHEAIRENPHHSDDCLQIKFFERNHHCPPSHPVWKHQPECSCWVGHIADFLNKQ